jgi:hypothetical protein
MFVLKRLRNARALAGRHGIGNAAFHAALSALNKCLEVRILRAMCVETPAAGFECPPGYTVRVLTREQLRTFAQDPACDLSLEFVDGALAKGDQCFAVLHGNALAAYGWYAVGPTAIGMQDLHVRFSDDYVYMYKGFTHEAHRGRRLHAIAMTAALRQYLANGYKGLVSYVEATNFDSLRSCSRMGYFVFGTVWIARIGGRYRAKSSSGCAQYGFDVVPGAWGELTAAEMRWRSRMSVPAGRSAASARSPESCAAPNSGCSDAAAPTARASVLRLPTGAARGSSAPRASDRAAPAARPSRAPSPPRH